MTDATSPDLPLPTEKPAPKPGMPFVKSVHVFNCPNCGGQIKLRALGATMTAVCANCGSVVDVADGNLSIIQQASQAIRETPLEIGMRGKLQNTVWEVIGYTLKSDKTGVYFWEEYLLFNPYQGFRFLVQMDGHWSFVKMIKQEFEKPSFNCEVWLDKLKFKPFLQDDPTVQYVKGEFYWRIKKGDRAHTEDYVCPPYMLSFEYTEGDEVTSMCEYVEPDVIRNAFQPPHALPWRKGVGPNQPNPYHLGWLTATAAVAFGIALFIHISTMAASHPARVLTINETHMFTDRSRDFTSDPFEIPSKTNIEVASYAPVDNDWAEYGFSLVKQAGSGEDTSAETHNMRQAIEYWHGYDSDGYWSEGGQWSTEYFSAVPAGTYRVVYDVDSGLFDKGLPMTMDVRLTRGTTPWSNFFITLALLAIWPAFEWMQRSSFERTRWSNSDFAPDN